MNINERWRHQSNLLKSHGQKQLLQWWDTLSDHEQTMLLDDLEQIPWDTVKPLIESHVLKRPVPIVPHDLQPAPVFEQALEEAQTTKQYRAATRAGGELLKAGRVAALTVAGGQGTRLGVDGPKGMVVVTPVGARSLFHLFAESILAAQRKYGVAIPWYIMTSLANHEQTRCYFESHAYFGLLPTDVMFFSQGMLPAIDFAGKLLLEEKHRVALAPDGHGGVLKAMKRSGALADMRRRGVQIISYFQVDNPMAKPFDRLFLGLHALQNAEMSCKVCTKADDFEKVGNVCMSGGRVCVIEYSDFDPEVAKRRNPDGSRTFDAGNLAIHLLDVDFVDRIVTDRFALPFRRADKKVPCIDDRGHRVVPEQPNAVKLETFVFDALPQARNPVVLKVDRAEEFSPVKNATGVDSLETSQRDQIRRACRWLEAAGVSVPRRKDGEPDCTVIVSAGFALEADDIRARVGEVPALLPGSRVILE